MGISFVTPEAAVFALAALVPLAALVASERRAAAVRRAFGLRRPRWRALVPVVLALALLPALVAVAAAQPVIVRNRLLTQRADAEVFFVFDTSLSMTARTAPHGPTRLGRAKQEALWLERRLNDIPAGIASMTDRTLPHLLPTADGALFQRTLAQSIGIDRPPPSQLYPNRATTLQALLTIAQAHFFPPSVRHRIVVVFTDGETAPGSVRLTVRPEEVIPPLLVHVWAPTERIYVRGGKVDPRYRPDPSSAASLREFASITGGRAFAEDELPAVAGAIEAEAGKPAARQTIRAASRIALAPWFILGGVLPLGFLLYRRNA
jgi:hypothetical protein